MGRKGPKLFSVINQNNVRILTSTPVIIHAKREAVQSQLPLGLRGVQFISTHDMEHGDWLEMREMANRFNVEEALQNALEERRKLLENSTQE